MGSRATIHYEGLSSEKNEEIYTEYNQSKPVLNSKQNKIIENSIKEDKELLEKYSYLRQMESVFGFLSKWKRKLVLRVICVRVKIDRRRKEENRFKVENMEIFTAIEGLRYAQRYHCYISNNMGVNLKVYFDDDYEKSCFYYAPSILNRVNPDYLDGFYIRCWSVKEILKLKPSLKYSQIKGSDNPIVYMGLYSTCSGIEMLRKCGFSRLLNSKYCLNRLNKNDKSFMKFLFKCYEKKVTSYNYNFYAGYYNKYGQNLDYMELYKKIDETKKDLFSTRVSFDYYDSKKQEILKNIKAEELGKYLFKQGCEFRYYIDYLEMCYKVGHDLNDEYWRYPNILSKAHNKVMEELKNVQKLNSKLRYDMLNEVLKDLYQYNGNINGFDVFVTADINVIQKQCDVLYQCLIRNDYIYKEIMQENILVFFWKNGNPVATAEVFYNGKVGQFYGDERDRSKCEATPDLRATLDIWLKKAVLKKRHVSKKIKYYKGFYEKRGNTFIGYNNFEFEIGQTYATQFDDGEITKYGAKKCNSTNKVFHFCDSIEEISKHYSPKYYCQVEPLGPVLDCNGALLSNRIKIIKEVTFQEVGGV